MLTFVTILLTYSRILLPSVKTLINSGMWNVPFHFIHNKNIRAQITRSIDKQDFLLLSLNFNFRKNVNIRNNLL
jgi:hypothetical protein